MDRQPQNAADEQRCIHCPTADGIRCAGLDVRRFCELIDPECEQYDVNYRAVIVGEGLRSSATGNTSLGQNRESGPLQQITDGDINALISNDCCGGRVPYGNFDDEAS